MARTGFLVLVATGVMACEDGTAEQDTVRETGLALTGNGNVLNGVFTGGLASVVEIAAYNGAGFEVPAAYETDLTLGCADGYVPQGALCDDEPGTGSRTESVKQTDASGATWTNTYYTPPVTGVLVVDAGSVVRFDEARVFQMFADGKVTSLRLSVHPAVGVIPPAFDDVSWRPVTEFEAVGVGLLIEPSRVGDPTILPFDSQRSRYVRVEVRNDGSNGDADYLELRALKLFSVLP